MKVMITGASGFLGGHIADACIKRGDTIKVIVRKTSDISSLQVHGDKVEYIYGSIENLDTCIEATKDVGVIFHSAARVMDYGHRNQFLKTNVEATEHLIQAARQNKVKKFVFVSSPSSVAEFKDQVNINEDYPFPKKYLNYYSETKAISERYVLSQNSEELMTTAIRPRGIWGTRDKSGFVPKLLYKMKLGKLKNLAGGKPVPTVLCHVYNVVHACLLAADSDNVGGKAYFITDKKEIEAWDFLNQLAALFDVPPVTKNMNPKIGIAVATISETIWKLPHLRNNKSMPLSKYALGLLTKASTYDISNAEKDFGYTPIIDMQTGFEELKNWTAEIGGFDELTKYVR